jgi:hypothetical protein
MLDNAFSNAPGRQAKISAVRPVPMPLPATPLLAAIAILPCNPYSSLALACIIVSTHGALLYAFTPGTPS